MCHLALIACMIQMATFELNVRTRGNGKAAWFSHSLLLLAGPGPGTPQHLPHAWNGNPSFLLSKWPLPRCKTTKSIEIFELIEVPNPVTRYHPHRSNQQNVEPCRMMASYWYTSAEYVQSFEVCCCLSSSHARRNSQFEQHDCQRDRYTRTRISHWHLASIKGLLNPLVALYLSLSLLLQRHIYHLLIPLHTILLHQTFRPPLRKVPLNHELKLAKVIGLLLQLGKAQTFK